MSDETYPIELVLDAEKTPRESSWQISRDLYDSLTRMPVNAALYCGYTKEGIPHGFTRNKPPLNMCVANCVPLRGTPHGLGTMVDANKQVFTGTWKDGKLVGLARAQSVRVGNSGNFYTGGWLDSKPHGEGSMSKGHDRMEGTWDHGKMVGVSKATDFSIGDGRRYTGPCLDGVPHGKGKISRHDCGDLVGEWKNGILQAGIGKIPMPSDNDVCSDAIYDGEYTTGGIPHGLGELTGNNIAGRYSYTVSGLWENGVEHGEMKCTQTSRNYDEHLICKFKYTAVNGKCPQKIYVTFADGRKYHGDWDIKTHGFTGDGELHNGHVRGYVKMSGKFVDLRLDGYGSISTKRESYRGEWKLGKRHGYGVSRCQKTGRSYAGNYEDDRENGDGTMTFTDGRKYVGVFHDGKVKEDSPGTLCFRDGSSISFTLVNVTSGQLRRRKAFHDQECAYRLLNQDEVIYLDINETDIEHMSEADVIARRGSRIELVERGKSTSEIVLWDQRIDKNIFGLRRILARLRSARNAGWYVDCAVVVFG